MSRLDIYIDLFRGWTERDCFPYIHDGTVEKGEGMTRYKVTVELEDLQVDYDLGEVEALIQRGDWDD